MPNILLSANQAIQLAALGPCILIIFYIILSSTKFKLSILPILFFVSLSLNFLLPIISLFPEFEKNKIIDAIYLFNKNTLPAISFLLIIQFLLSAIPPPIYWLVLAIPLVGGAPFTYLATYQDLICLDNDSCYSSANIEMLYHIFGASLMFMLLIFVLVRIESSIKKNDKNKNHKYWILITIVIFNVGLIGLDLSYLSGKISTKELNLIQTVIGVGFVYIIMSSVFRIFSEGLGIKPWKIRSDFLLTRDRKILENMQQILAHDKPYRALGFNRRALAEILGVKEHTVTRIINENYQKSFSELMNEYRIGDAKKSLREGNDPVTMISFDTGFSSITSFNRVFKESTGVSPREYRKTGEIKINQIRKRTKKRK